MEKVTTVEGLEGKNPSEKVTYIGEISEGMTDNDFFADAGTKVTAMVAAGVELQSALSGGNTILIAQKEEDVDTNVKIVVNYVQGKIIGKDPALAKVMVESANLNWKDKGVIHIHDIEVTKTEVALTVAIRRKALVKVDNKRVNPAYVWQKCVGNPAVAVNWVYLKTSMVATVHDVVVKGQETFYRVATVLGEEQSEFSVYVSVTW